jgi:hypothetical protein
VVMVHSLGGGTGSGMGSRLLESMRDELGGGRGSGAGGGASIVTACVAPFAAGDTPLQYFNMALSLATAQECADAILYFDNDDLLNRARVTRRVVASLATGASASAVASARARAKSGRGAHPDDDANRVATGDMNALVAQTLATVLLPTRHRRKLPRGAQAAVGASSPADGRPGWHDVREDVKAEDAFANPYDGKWDDEDDDNEVGQDAGRNGSAAERRRRSRAGVGKEGEGSEGEDSEAGEHMDGRAGWIHASMAASATAASQRSARAGGVGAPPAGGAGGGGLVACAFDAAALAAALVPSPMHKFVDVRSAAPAVRTGTRAGADSAAASWSALAEGLSDIAPRFDADGRPVLALASRLIARGASQTDCDSVDASITPHGAMPAGLTEAEARAGGRPSAGAAGGSGGGRGGQPVYLGRTPVAPWTGLPGTEEWQRVNGHLAKMYALAPGAAPHATRSAVLSPAPAFPPGGGGGGAVASSSLLPARTLTVAANTTWMVPSLVRCVARCDAMIRAGAYLHWYERFGVGAEDVEAAAESLARVVEAYADVGRR